MAKDNTIGDLSESARGEMRADLSAGSAGYQHFLQQLSGYISPEEAVETEGRFRRAWRVLWLAVVAYVVLYVAVNQIFGPWSLPAVGWGNDALRGAVFLAAVVLGRRGVGVAGQVLMPLASLCYLPMPTTAQPGGWQGPLMFGGMLAALFLCGWCVDAGLEQRKGGWIRLRTWLRRIAAGWFLLTNVIAWLWVLDQGTFPVLSIAAAVGGWCLLETGKPAPGDPTDVEFLYAAAWKRWRFFISGRGLAVVLGILPFLMFATLLDYQEQLERALEVVKAPDIVRMDSPFDGWDAFYWRQQGRFLSEADFRDDPKEGSAISRLYLAYPSSLTDPDSRQLPPEFRGDAHRITLPENYDPAAAQAGLLTFRRRRMSREAFLKEIAKFDAIRITSRADLLRRTVDPTDQDNLIEVSFDPTGPEEGVCFARLPHMEMYSRATIEHLLDNYSVPKWIFFVYGVFGFIVLWRRGGDSSLARWVGIWLIGVSLVPTLTASDDTLPHVTDWLWRQSVMYHWNTLASAAQPLYNLLFFATGATAILWMTQMSAAVCWTYVCWPTRIYPNLPVMVRNLMVIGKLAAVLFANSILFLVVYFTFALIYPTSDGLVYFIAFIAISTALFLVSGWVLRKFTHLVSEVPRLGVVPVVAMVALNLSVMFYAPILLFDTPGHSGALSALGAVCGCGFILLMGFMILKQDFLRVRAIAGFTTLLLVLLVPLAAHFAEDSVPRFLTSGPFFRERGAEMVVIMLVVLLFPWLHRQMHELLLFIAVPKLRQIEHSVEHAMEKIVDAENEVERARLVSDLFERLHVPHYLFLSRRPKGVFTTDINKLERAAPESLELSEPLRKFLGTRRNFVDLKNMAYEWPFFFQQFELYRLEEKAGCVYVLPVLVGESLRGLLLLPDGPGGSVMSNPAVTVNINNFGIAAALSRPER